MKTKPTAADAAGVAFTNRTRHKMTTDDHWLIGDLHLGHANVLKHDNRPYANISEHDRDLGRQCAGVGRKSRTLWLVGDIAQTKAHLVKFMDEIRPHWGKIILIRGNHDDKVAWRLRDMFDEAHEARYLRVDVNVKVYISHYAHRTWRNSHHGAYHIHAHSHGALPRLGRSADCGAPCVEYAPKPLTWFVEQLKDQPCTNHHPKLTLEDVAEAQAICSTMQGMVGTLTPVAASSRCLRDLRVVSVSSNANAFGLKGVVMMDLTGRAWEMGVSVTVHGFPKPGDIFTAEITPDGEIIQGSLPFTFEIPRRLTDAPPEVIREVWA